MAEALREFQSQLSSKVPILRIESAVDLSDPHGSRATSPALRRAGVYLYFDDREQLLWVGSATGMMRRRFAAHERRGAFGLKRARWVDVIAFPRLFYYHALSLEAFLIARCRPICNVKLVVPGVEYEAERSQPTLFDLWGVN